MKNIHRLFTYIITPSVFLLFLTACNKDIIEADANWQALTPSKLDTAAGNWKPCVITAGEVFNIPAPEAVNSSAYQKELVDIKAALANQTAEQQAVIKYWSAGTVLRWNEIMRALVAKYNLAPQDSAGVYPIPNAANPFAYPQFPFSNPPYAARSYAYVSVAQYDALVAAYKLKQQYRRPAPYKTDASITPSVSKSDLYSFPSDEAVVATTTFEVMKNLFPTEVEFLTKKAEECRRFKYWAGATTASDIAAGDSLGKQIAAKIMARARTDNMSLAVGNQAKWDSLANRPTLLRTVDGKETLVADKAWYSEESPKRPPMLPFYGNVKAWFFTNPAAVRIAAPPITSAPEIQSQVTELYNITSNLTRKQIEIAHYWADGTGTQTPPGHWNAIACQYFQPLQMSEIRMARNLSLMNMAMMDAAITCWDIKTTYNYPRPSNLDKRIKTITGLPNFPGYTSGHSTFSGAAATFLSYLLPSEKNNLDNMAKDASISRQYGGIHLRIDCEVGLQSGNKIGELAVLRARTDGAD
jgi:membrane-associated phospholipid phosphatase